MAQVVLTGVNKVYPGGFRAVADVNLSIADGEFAVLVGPSGCGKSTTLRMIAGLESVSSGTVAIGDRVVNDVEPKDRNIAMVFQSYALYPHLSVRDNLAFGLKLRKAPAAEIERKVGEAARTLGIAELLDRKPKALSGGQRQRVALGRALVRDPDVFLFDEPLSNLDAKMRVQMRTEISRLHHRLGTTMIYVTHDQVEAMTMGQRIVVMHQGEVQQVDTPLALYNRPANLFVAGFIGSPAMNFLDGRLVRRDGLRFVAETPDGAEPLAIPLPAGWSPRARAGAANGAAGPAGAGTPAAVERLLDRPLVLGIRPEHVALRARDAADAFAAPVQVIEPLGNETLLYFTVAGRLFVVRGPGDADAAVDRPVGLALAAEHVHLFDPASGQALLA